MIKPRVNLSDTDKADGVGICTVLATAEQDSPQPGSTAWADLAQDIAIESTLGNAGPV